MRIGNAVLRKMPHPTGLGSYEITTDFGRKIIKLGFDDLQEVRSLLDKVSEELGLDTAQVEALTKQIRGMAKIRQEERKESIK